MIEHKIIEVSTDNIAKLYGPSKMAAEKPDTGVKILNKSAYYVIRDCANITRHYLPLLVYGKLQSPIELLKGKLTEADIVDFVNRAETSLETKQLLYMILVDINSEADAISPFTNIEESTDPEENVYGEYGAEVTDEGNSIQIPIEISIENKAEVITKLKEAFGV